MEQATPLIIANFADQCGEGPLWDAPRQTLYWTDCVGERLYEYSWSERSPKLLRTGFPANGMVLHEDGGLILSNNSGYWYWDREAPPIPLTPGNSTQTTMLNDCAADSFGRVISSSVHYRPDADYALGHLVLLDTTRAVRTLDEGFHLGNGLAFSPDGQILYFADSVARRIYAFDYNAETAQISRRRIFVQVPLDEGLPDGLAVDELGFVWSAQWYGSCVVRYDPDGKTERKLFTPAKQTSSLAFGGPDLTQLFITTAGKSEPMPVMPAGYDPHSGYFGGALFHCDCGIRGQPKFPARIRRAS